MRIGDEVYIHGYIDEIRKNTVIIQNEGGYFGTVPSEIKLIEPKPKVGRWIDGHCSECGCDVPAYIIDWKWQKDMNANYCPNCGTRMAESEVENG